MSNRDRKKESHLGQVIPISRFNRGEAGRIFRELRHSRTIVVTKHHMPVAVLLDPEEFDKIQETITDAALLSEAYQRTQQYDPADTLSEAQLIKRLGIQGTELDDGMVEIDQ